MGLALELYHRQRGTFSGRAPQLTNFDPDQLAYRCIYRESNPLRTFKGCLNCPETIDGFECQHPAILAKRRPNHICLVNAPKLKDKAAEEGYFVCAHCEHRTTFTLPKNPRWSVGVTTAPRRQRTLDVSLPSLYLSGFTEFTLYAEPDTNLHGVTCPIIKHSRRLGAWTNWYTTLQHLTKSDPDVVLICQDDVIYAREIRKYIESNWPPGAEVVSFYRSSWYKQEGTPFIKAIPTKDGIRGALTLAIARQTAERMITSKLLQGYARQLSIDGIVGRWCRLQGIEVYICNPSLADHIGDTSTIYPFSPNAGKRRSDNFLGESSVAGQTT